MGQEVRLSLKTFIGLLALLMTALIGLAFMLGRLSLIPPPPPAPSPPPLEARPSPRPLAVAPLAAPPPSRPTVIAAPPLAAVPMAAAPLVSAPVPPPVLPAPAAPVQAAPKPAPLAPPPPPAQPPPAAPPAAVDPAIAGYFKQIDRLLQGTPNLDNGSQFANDLIQQSLQGNTQGFDQLLASTQKVRSQMAQVQPPRSCAEHHRLSLRQLDQSLQLLTKVKNATVALDSAALTSLAEQGRSLQAEAEQLKQLDRQLRQP